MARKMGFAAFVSLMSLFAQARAQSLPTGVPATDQTAVGRRGYFYAGGNYIGEGANQSMDGQLYVEVVVPREIKQRYPLIFVHGAAQTGTNWLAAADGGPGWADYFVKQGYVIYMVDQPARGRSAYNPANDGKLTTFTAKTVEDIFTATAHGALWPQAKLQTQWPGTGRRGDPIFDAFYATQVPSLASPELTQTKVQAALIALLDRIGPAILVTHSQSGTFGWLIADTMPDKIKGLLSIEPSGVSTEARYGNGPPRAWGLADIPMTYDAGVTSPSDLHFAQEAAADAPDLARCWLQVGTVHMLPKMQGVPMVVVTSESSFHARLDHCTVKFLKQAGVDSEFIRLEDRGIHGNGHMMMLEKNNQEVAALLDEWIHKNVH